MSEIQTGQDGSLENQEALAAEQEKINAAKAELYDEQQRGEEEGLILGKYRTQEDLVEAYRNLQRENERMRNGQPPDVELESERDRPDEQQEQEQEEEEEEENDQAENQLTEEDAIRIRDGMFKQVGGQEKYQALIAWANENITQQQADAYQQALDAGDEQSIMTQLKSFQYDMMMSRGYEPKLTGGRAPTQDIKGFESEAQVVAAMSDPRYSGSNPDHAYIREVERRMAVSKVFMER